MQREVVVGALIGWFASSCAFAQSKPAAASGGAKLPVREVTVFKDGHAFVVRQEKLAAAGEVVLDELPVPVLGTFWPFATGGAKLVSAKASRDKVASEADALDLRQLIEANVGKDAAIVDTSNTRIEGKLLAPPTRKENDAVQPGSFVMLATTSGTRAIPLANVRDLEIQGELATKVRTEEQRERLTLRVEGGGADAQVGVMYVQKGLRWIPSYKLDIDGAGKASVQFEGTLVNDLIDLERARVNLVIGVPKFEFAGLVDPISLQQEAAAVASRMPARSDFSNFLSNSIMTQSGRFEGGAEAAPTPEVTDASANEDLFVFTLSDVSLKRGERLVLPIASFELSYHDVYTLDVPFAPPAEVRQGFSSDRVLELAKSLGAPKAVHVLRLKNTASAPLTTAPVLVLSKGRVLAQGRVGYTPVGVESDLAINTAIDVGVELSEHETGRTPDAVTWNRTTYGRIDLAGTIEVTNRKSDTLELEVSRKVLGLVDEVGQGGSKTQLDLATLWSDTERPLWWSWWGWPYWWFHFNGFGEFRWTVKLAPGAKTTLDASWHYFWD